MDQTPPRHRPGHPPLELRPRHPRLARCQRCRPSLHSQTHSPGSPPPHCQGWQRAARDWLCAGCVRARGGEGGVRQPVGAEGEVRGPRASRGYASASDVHFNQSISYPWLQSTIIISQDLPYHNHCFLHWVYLGLVPIWRLLQRAGRQKSKY